MKKTLILGFGNFDREDDGVAWHILARLAARLGRPFPATPEDELPECNGDLDFIFQLQLTPELAEVIKDYDRVCFVDAHTGSVPNDVNFQPVAAEFQNSPLTHHMTAATVMNLTQLYGAQPDAILVSVRGNDFGFDRRLTPQTDRLADQAVDQILAWLQE